MWWKCQWNKQQKTIVNRDIVNNVITLYKWNGRVFEVKWKQNLWIESANWFCEHKLPI